MKHVTSLKDITSDDVRAIFDLASRASGTDYTHKKLTAAFSFEGAGIRTRTTFLKALPT